MVPPRCPGTASHTVGSSDGILVVIPCLNEAANIGSVLDFVRTETSGWNAVKIVVVDGGSRDGTQGLVRTIAQIDRRVALLHNERRIQSAGINLAVERFGDDLRYLIRIDAHSGYDEGLFRILIDDMHEHDAQSVVVSMCAEAAGKGIFQRAVAEAQNTVLGHGGSAHRKKCAGRYVEHGHHALIDLATFRRLGGYDPSFTHNEDAEFDHRLTTGGGRIWMTGKIHIRYYPRATPGTLFWQYYNHGSGRARNMMKHATWPRLRQCCLLALAPFAVLAVLSAFWTPLILPAASWLFASIAYSAYLAYSRWTLAAALAGCAAIIMHFAWSLGFWRTYAFGRAK